MINIGDKSARKPALNVRHSSPAWNGSGWPHSVLRTRTQR